MSICVTMSSVSDFQSLDLYVAYYCVAVTPLHLPGCCFSINITLEAASLSHSRGSTPEGTQNQSAVEEGSVVRSLIITLE